MKLVLRILAEYVPLWRIWAPLLALTVLIPPLVLLIPVIEQRLVDDVILPQRLDLLPLTAVSWIVAWSVSTALGLVRTWVRSYLSERMLVQLRERMFAQCQSLSVGFVRREHSGRTLALINNDAAALADFFGTTIVTTLGVLVGMVLTLTLMVSLSWQLGLFAGILPLVLAGLGAMVARPLRPATRRVQEKVAELNERLHESLSGLREIVAFGYERQQGLKIGQTLSELLRLRMRVTLIDTGLNAGRTSSGLL